MNPPKFPTKSPTQNCSNITEQTLWEGKPQKKSVIVLLGLFLSSNLSFNQKQAFYIRLDEQSTE